MIEHLSISDYRSVRRLSLDLAPLTVVVGENGVGKTNLYRALELIRSAATGTLARDLASEGGMPSDSSTGPSARWNCRTACCAVSA